MFLPKKLDVFSCQKSLPGGGVRPIFLEFTREQTYIK
jgi:hypothetical protein